ncbi:hypothetical protein TI39_contig615g00014 [Zymoseptoria brevis]|uniref:Uncharacterized protein n=1 Tax=Zymoseptoria brevis TaxID=1047168 RepID=A0A0F4GHP8_9PEZI|nr:hypothetical protein TI39_contig615g00014 [Zymoseptoria brevis]
MGFSQSVITFESSDVAGALSLDDFLNFDPPTVEEPGDAPLTPQSPFLTSYGFDPGNTNAFGIIATVSYASTGADFFRPDRTPPYAVTPVVTFPIGVPTTTLLDEGIMITVTPTSVVTCAEYNDGLLPEPGSPAATDQITCQIPNTAIAPGIVTVSFLGSTYTIDAFEVEIFTEEYSPLYLFSIASSTRTTSIKTSTSTSFVDASIVASTTVTDTSYLVTAILLSQQSALLLPQPSALPLQLPARLLQAPAGLPRLRAQLPQIPTLLPRIRTLPPRIPILLPRIPKLLPQPPALLPQLLLEPSRPATQAVFILEAYGVPRIPDGSDGATQPDDTFRFAASNTGTLLALLENGQVVDSSGRAASVPTSRGLRKRQESVNGSRIFFAAADDDSFEACDCDISSDNKLSCTCDSLSGLIIGTSGDLLGVLAIGKLDGFKECVPVAVVDPQPSAPGSIPTYPTSGSIPEVQTDGTIPEYLAGGSVPTYATGGLIPAYAADASSPFRSWQFRECLRQEQGLV